MLQIQVGDHLVQLGASADNILNGKPPSQLVRQLLEARLQYELGGRSSHSITEAEVSRDWQMLRRTMAVDSPPTAHVIQRSETARGNQP